MVENQHDRRLRCPYCNWERTVFVQERIDSSLTDVARYWGRALGASVQKVHDVVRNAELDAANAKYDIKCAHCGRTYYFNVTTGAVEP